MGTSPGTYWINSETRETLSVPLPEVEMTKILGAYGLDDPLDLIRGRFIVYGWLDRRRDGSGYLVRPHSPEWFDVRLEGEDPVEIPG